MAANARLLWCCTFVVLYAVCVLGGSRFTSDLNETTNAGKNLGMCQAYNGMNCRTTFNSTLRFINMSIGFNTSEKVSVAFSQHAIKQAKTEDDKKCLDIILKVVCFYVFPPCSGDGERLDYCREDCVYLFKICGAQLNRLRGAGEVLIDGDQKTKYFFRYKECEQLASEKDNLANNSCIHLPFLDIPPSKPASMFNKTLVIILGIVIPLIFLLLIACVWYRRVVYNRKRLHSVHYENGKDDSLKKTDRLSAVVSMRDRIQEWKVAPTEMNELLDICKSRGVEAVVIDDIEYLKDLGSGQYGLVFQGKMEEIIEGETSDVVAVKTLREGSTQDAIKDFCQEVNIMSTFSHPNVVRLIAVSLGGEPYCMIFEFVEFGDLASFLRSCAEVEEESNSAYPKLSITDLLSMSLQIASGMKYISAIRCVHRDLAARNCLVGRGLVIKISDFGLSRDVYASEYYRMDKIRMLPVRWLPPEAFVDGKFTTYSDIYSFGVLLWEIFTFAKLPYEEYDNEKAMELILDGQILEIPEGCPTPVFDIMKKCWEQVPEARIPFSDIINELCSLDEYGARFMADDAGQAAENYQGQKEHNALSFTNNINLDDPPINVERLPAIATKKPTAHHYSMPSPMVPRVSDGGKVAYDGVVTLSENAGGNEPRKTNYDVEEPRAVYHRTPPEDVEVLGGSYGAHDGSNCASLENQIMTSKTRLISEDDERSQETYDVPPVIPQRHVSQCSDHLYNNDDEEQEETYAVPPVPQRGRHGDHDVPQETYDVPPTPSHGDEPQETYDVPPTSHVPFISLQNPQGDQEEVQELRDVPPTHDRISRGDEGAQETYDVPPIHDRISGDDEGPQETYDVPPRHQESDLSDELYQNSANLQTGYYSVPNSPYLNRRNQNTEQNASAGMNQSKLSSSKRKSPYENVNFDGTSLVS